MRATSPSAELASGQLPLALSRSFEPSWRKTRIGLLRRLADHRLVVVSAFANVVPLAMFVKLPTHERTLRNSLGRSQATVKAQMPPLLTPRDRAAGRVVAQLRRLLDLGQDLFEQEARVLVGERVVLEAAVRLACRRTMPGWMKMPTVTGMSPFAIRLSKTIGTYSSVAGAVLEDHHARRALGLVLRRHVDPPVARRAGEDLALPRRASA